MSTLPDRFIDAAHLEDVMSTPSAALVADLAAIPGDLMVLGVGGKMGPTLARMAKRAAPDKRVIGVARFSEPGLRAGLQAHGIECIAADLLSKSPDALVDKPLHEQLSEREYQVFHHLARGKAVTEISESLSIDVKIVNVYRSRLMGKMGLRTHSEIARYAAKNGLIELSSS